ncbi:MAG: Dihydrolipoyllysine-residue acetyltransferase component of pyruvate dehydrogenase complex, partial [Planctomycetota bacterium]
MPIEFKLPEVSEGVSSVDVADVRVKAGDLIKPGTTVCEVETDKAVAEITCPHAGRITQVLVQPGQTIKIGDPLLLI